MRDYIIVSRSARSLAKSAKLAGYRVHALDCYADKDTKEVSASVKKISYFAEGFIEKDLLNSLDSLLSIYSDSEIVVGSGFENNPMLIENMSKLAKVYSNSVNTIRLLKKIESFSGLLDKNSINHPKISKVFPDIAEKYLAKKNYSMGGESICWADDVLNKKSGDFYFQEYIDGAVSSVVFIADGEHSKLIGFNNLQISKQFSNKPFLYSGVRMSSSISIHHKNKIKKIVDIIVGESCLHGLCGIDYIYTEKEQIYVLEVNPRPPASFELYDKSGDLFKLHILSFTKKLKNKYNFNLSPNKLSGCTILYADFDWTVPDNVVWPKWVFDIPVYGENIKQYNPICTVFADGYTEQLVDEKLVYRLCQIRKILFKN